MIQSKQQAHLRRLLPALCCAAVFLVLFFAQCISGRYSDDYYYATFWRGGLAPFLSRNLDHYRTFNGRVLVHLLVQTLLVLPQWAVAAVDTVWLLLTGLLGLRALGGVSGRGRELSGLALFGAGVLLVGRQVLAETLLWDSGYYNYIFPVFLTVLACLTWDRWLGGGTARALWWLLPVQFLCGATTEQCGVMTGVGTFCLGLVWLLRERPGWKRGWRAAWAPLANLMGYLTIFLSPATRERARTAGSFTLRALLSGLPRWARNLLAPEGIVPLVLLFCSAAVLYGVLRGKKLLLLGLPAAGGLLLYPILGRPGKGAVLLVCYLFAYLLLAAVLLAEESPAASALLAAAVAGQVIMLPTNTFVARSVMPFALPLILVGTFLCIRCFSLLPLDGRWERLLPAGLMCAGVLLSAIRFAPTLAGYWGNHLIEAGNEASATRTRQTGEPFYYCIDFDPHFGLDTRMYKDGYFFQTYLNMEQLNGAPLYIVSSVRPRVLVDGRQLQSPAWPCGEEYYLPAAQTVRAMGGKVDWSSERTVYAVNGIEAVLDHDNTAFTCRKGTQEWVVEVRGEFASPYYTQCFSPRVLEEALDLTFSFDEQENVYRLERG